MTDLRLVFAGSPEAAVPSLRALVASNHEVAAVVTREDSPLGRRRVLTPTSVAQAAEELGLPVIKTNRLDAAASDAIAALKPDLGVIVAYGGLVREPLLSTPALGWINLHFSLLPRWRGAAPVQRAIMAGDQETGVSIFGLVSELDAGDVYAVAREPIGAQQTAGSLLRQLAASGAVLLAEVVDSLADGTARAEPQSGEVTFAPKLSLADAELDWHEPAERVHARIRGVTPEPGAFATVDGTRLKVLESAIARDLPALPAGDFARTGNRVVVGTGTVPLELVTVLPAGRRAMAGLAWWRGRAPGAS